MHLCCLKYWYRKVQTIRHDFSVVSIYRGNLQCRHLTNIDTNNAPPHLLPKREEWRVIVSRSDLSGTQRKLHTPSLPVDKTLGPKLNLPSNSLPRRLQKFSAMLVLKKNKKIFFRISHQRWELVPAFSSVTVLQGMWLAGAGWSVIHDYLYPDMWWRLLCSSRSSLRADRLVEKSTGRDVNWFQLRSSFSKNDREKKAYREGGRQTTT